MRTIEGSVYVRKSSFRDRARLALHSDSTSGARFYAYLTPKQLRRLAAMLTNVARRLEKKRLHESIKAWGKRGKR